MQKNSPPAPSSGGEPPLLLRTFLHDLLHKAHINQLIHVVRPVENTGGNHHFHQRIHRLTRNDAVRAPKVVSVCTLQRSLPPGFRQRRKFQFQHTRRQFVVSLHRFERLHHRPHEPQACLRLLLHR